MYNRTANSQQPTANSQQPTANSQQPTANSQQPTSQIPKIIHYCWFGGNKMPESEEAYVSNWKKILQNYEFMLWNENNVDINSVRFTQQVANSRKWGFIVDYVRAYAIYHYGGIYLDTDVEVLKPFDELLKDNICFSGFEDERNMNPGSVFAGRKGCIIAKEVMDFYSDYDFINKNGSLNLTPSPQILSSILIKHGLKQNNTYQELGVFTAYPTEYFTPKSFITGILNITENTYSIHHFSGSWFSSKERKKTEERWTLFAKFDSNITQGFLELINENSELKDTDVNTLPLASLYKIIMKRTIKKLLGKRLTAMIKRHKGKRRLV